MGRGRSRGAAAGSRRQQEWGDAVGPGLGGGGFLAVRSEGGRSGVPLWHAVELGRRVQAV